MFIFIGIFLLPPNVSSILAGTQLISSTSPPICFSSQSMVLTKNIVTNEIKETEAQHLLSSTHQVFDTINGQFIPIRSIIVCWSNKFILIKKNTIDKDKPNNNFFITPGHMLRVDGKMIKARDVKKSMRITTDSQKIYSICTDHSVPLLVNNLEVMSWDYDRWLNNSLAKST